MNIDFEIFEEGPAQETADKLHVTIDKRGHFYLNRHAVHALGGTDAVTLGYDSKRQIIGMIPTDLRRRSAFPLRNNLNGVTAGTVQLQTPFELGHFIVFDTTGTQSQVACFLSRVGTPEGPAIVSPRGVDDSCD